MNERACRILRRILALAGTGLVCAALGGCGLPGYHFRDGTTPWLPGGAPSPPAARKKSTPNPVRKPDPGIPALSFAPGIDPVASRRSHEN